MTITHKWIIFPEDATESYIRWHMARNQDANGYFTGIPPRYMAQSIAEDWKLPYTLIETFEVPDGQG